MKTLLNGREVVLLWSFLLMSSVIMSSATWAAPKAEILEYGFYSFTDGSERLMQPITTSGYVTKGKTQLDKNTNRIPLEIGRLFGFRFVSLA